MKLRIVARASNLSKAQTEEVKALILRQDENAEFEMLFCKTYGDLDHSISLREEFQSDLFTREVDEKLLSFAADIAVHSAKDLPSKIHEDLTIAKLTQGVNPRDSLVFKEGFSLQTIPKGGKVLASSKRREEALLKLRPDLVVEDVRGTIDERLSKLKLKDVYGIVIAEAALIRLGLLSLPRLILDGKTHPLQGKLAICCLKARKDLIEFFQGING